MSHVIISRIARYLFAFLTVLASFGAASASADPPPDHVTVEPFVTGMQFVTAIAIAADGDLYLAENNTKRINIYDPTGSLLGSIAIPGSQENEVGAVLGIALDPDYPSAPYLYVHYLDRISWSNMLIRFRWEQGVISDISTLMDIPLPYNEEDPDNPCTEHNGGHITFDHKGALLMGMGDNCRGDLVDDLGNPQGSILRVNRETGEALLDNPFYDGDGPNDDRIWAKGQRNPFGLTTDPATGRIWSSDNGPGCADEVNLIVSGAHYGWPHSSTNYFTCLDPGSEYRAPAWLWDKTIGPTGISAYNGHIGSQWQNSLFMCDWNTPVLRRLQLNAARDVIIAEEELDLSPAECLIDVASGPDGNLYIADIEVVYRVVSVPMWLPLMLVH